MIIGATREKSREYKPAATAAVEKEEEEEEDNCGG